MTCAVTNICLPVLHVKCSPAFSRMVRYKCHTCKQLYEVVIESTFTYKSLYQNKSIRGAVSAVWRRLLNVLGMRNPNMRAVHSRVEIKSKLPITSSCQLSMTEQKRDCRITRRSTELPLKVDVYKLPDKGRIIDGDRTEQLVWNADGSIGVARGCSGCICTPQGGEKKISGLIYRKKCVSAPPQDTKCTLPARARVNF